MKMGYHSAIGLDCGRDAIKVVRAERRGRAPAMLTQAAILHLSRDNDEAEQMTRRWLETLGFMHEPCVIALPGRSIILKALELEAGDPRTLRQAAALEVQKLRSLTTEDILCDTAAVPVAGGKRVAMLFVARPDTLDAALSLPEAIGLDVRDVIPSSVALLNLTSRLAEGTGPSVTLDVGHLTTELIIGDRRGVRFSRTFDMGVGRFAEALALEQGISVVQAHDRLMGGDCLSAARAGGALHEVLQAWLGEVDVSLALYHDRFPGNADAPHAAIVTGGGGCLKGISNLLGRATGLSVADASVLAMPGVVQEGPSYSLAAGLALAGVESGVSRVSLAPPAMKRLQAQRKDKWVWAAAAALVLVAGVMAGAAMIRGRAHERMVEEETRRQEGIKQELGARLGHLQQDNGQLLATLKPVFRLVRQRVAVVDLIRAIGEARGGLDWFVSLEIMPVSTNPAVAGPAVNVPPVNVPDPGFEVLLRGYTPDARLYSVRNMITALQENPRIENADLVAEQVPSGTDVLASRWAPLNGIPFTLSIRTKTLKAEELPSPSEFRAMPPTRAAAVRSIREQELLTRDILGCWSAINRDFSTFKNRADVFNLPPLEEVALIDFRVALQETRRKLLEQAARHGTELPSDLGLREMAGRDKNVRHLLYQLATIRKLADLALEQGVSGIGTIDPMEPEIQTFGSLTCLEQYPVRVTLKSRLPVLMGLLQELGNPQHFMGLRGLSIRRMDVNSPEQLQVTLEVASLVFPETPDAATLTIARVP